jgi:hypothetical protein
MPWDTLGVSFNPPLLLMMLNRLCVMTVTMNRQMSTPTYFLTIQTLMQAARRALLSLETEDRLAFSKTHDFYETLEKPLHTRLSQGAIRHSLIPAASLAQ